jgi:hypothetical protein
MIDAIRNHLDGVVVVNVPEERVVRATAAQVVDCVFKKWEEERRRRRRRLWWW